MKLSVNLATLGPIGYLPKCPGTFGSLPGILIGALASSLPMLYGAGLLALFLVASIWTSGQAARYFAKDDPSQVVIDEALGMAITLFHIKIAPLTIVLSFILFRLFDILKPPPVRQLDSNLSGGLGIVMDDVAAGIMANVALRVLNLFFGI